MKIRLVLWLAVLWFVVLGFFFAHSGKCEDLDSQGCSACHVPNAGDHPVGMAPKGPVPSTLPLSPDGKVECTTCHYPHQGPEEPAGLRLLGNELCAACHPSLFD